MSVVSGRRTAARSQHATRGLRATERPPLSRVRTSHVAGCTAPALIHSASQQRCPKSQTFTLCPLFFFLSERRLHNAEVDSSAPPVDSAHVDNIHRMSIILSINQRHLMKAQLGASQVYKLLSSLSTPATPSAQQCSVCRVGFKQIHFFTNKKK